MTKTLELIKQKSFIGFIYLYIFLMPWNFTNGQMGFLSIILFIWWLVIAKKNEYFTKIQSIVMYKPLILFILFLLYSYISLFWTDNFENAKISLKYYKYYWLMIPVLLTTLSYENAKKSIYILFISIGIYSLFSISIFLEIINITSDTTSPSTPSNPRGILAYAIVTPYMAILALSSVPLYIYSKNKYLKNIFLFFGFSSFIALFLNNGRAGQLAFFATIGVLIFLLRKYFFKHPKVILILIVALVLSLMLLSSTGKFDRLSGAFLEFQNLEQKHFDGSWGHRAYMWYAAGDILQDKTNFIFGTGSGDNIDEFIKYTKDHPSKATWLRSFHNQHLDTLTKYGIIGYTLLWGSILLLLYKIKDKILFYYIGIIFFSITFFDGLADIILLMKPFNTIFMLMFLLLSIISVKEEK